MNNQKKQKRILFGTDGIRGKANIYPMTGETAFALGRAVTHYFQFQQDKRPLIVLGKDTRLSCYMLEQALAAGICSQGGEVVLTGPLPTPGVAFVTVSMRADAGVMISASHNDYRDNGIKIFDAKGIKLPDQIEVKIESLVLNPTSMPVKVDDSLGNAKRLKGVYGRYLVHTKAALSRGYDMEGIRVFVDCAHGASYKVSPMMFRELGAKVFVHGVEPNGININHKCGSLYPQAACDGVKTYQADLGVCLDGDADRLVAIDERGEVIHGDRLIVIFAKLLLDQGHLGKGDYVVGTVMSNLGVESYLADLGLKFYRTEVGDRYIVEHMRRLKSPFGGEPSGHLIFSHHSTTGDGSLAALKLVECMRFYKKSVSELIKDIVLFPQVLKNTKVREKIPFEEVTPIQTVLKDAREEMGRDGRVLLRYSGTGPLARVMVEGKDKDLIHKICDRLVEVVGNTLG